MVRKFRHGGKVPSPGAADGRILFHNAAIMKKLETALKGLFQLAHAGPPIIVVSFEDVFFPGSAESMGKIFFVASGQVHEPRRVTAKNNRIVSANGFFPVLDDSFPDGLSTEGRRRPWVLSGEPRIDAGPQLHKRP